MKKALLLVSVVANLLIVGAVRARSPVSLESTYLGGGWFRYTVGVVDDPFFHFLDVNAFGFSHPSLIEYGTNPSGWTNGPTIGSWDFAGPSPGSQTRPYSASFLVRSSETHFKRSGSAALLFTLSTIGGYHGIPETGTVGGFWNAPVLVPCPASEADGSSTNLLVTCDSLTLPDIRITGLQRTAETIRGVSYEFSAENTVRLEGSRDLVMWTNIAYIHGNNGVTTWTTNRALNDFGNFFRLRLIDYGHAVNLPPLSALGGDVGEGHELGYPLGTADTPPSAFAESGRILAVRPAAGAVEVDFAAEPGRRYIVTAFRDLSRPIEIVTITAGEPIETVLIPRADDPSFCLLQVSEAQTR